MHFWGMLIWSTFPKTCLGHSTLFHDSNLSNLIELVDLGTKLIYNVQYHRLICYFENLTDGIIQHLITISKIKTMIHTMKTCSVTWLKHFLDWWKKLSH